MTTPFCAICGNRFEPDDDHVEIETEHVRMRDQNEFEEFVFHPACWRRLSEGWSEPV